MKRIALTVLAATFALALISCGQSPKAVFSANEDNLGCTPQEMIDYINSAVDYAREQTGNDYLQSIPDYETPGLLTIKDITLYFNTTVDESGNLTKLEIGCIPDAHNVGNMSVYLYAVASAFSKDGSTSIADDYEVAIKKPIYEYSYKTVHDRVQYDFHCTTQTLHTIEIMPSPD